LRPSEALSLGSWVVSHTCNLCNLLIREILSSLAISTLVHSADDSASKAEIVLQSNFGVLDGAVVGPATHVPDELCALSETSGAERVSLGDEASRGVDDDLAAICDAALSDELVGLADGSETQGLNSDHLVGGEAVVEFADLNIIGGNLGLSKSSLSSLLGHGESDELDSALVEEVGAVSGKALASNQDGLGLQLGTGVEEGLRDEDGGGSAIRGGAALELGEGLMEHTRLEHLLQGVLILELRVRVLLGVFMVDTADLSEILNLGAVPRRVSIRSKWSLRS